MLFRSDALGGEMGVNADKTAIQMRMLNEGKGEAVQSLRCQCDKNAYHREMKRTLENTDNLKIVQCEAAEILTDAGRVAGVMTTYGGIFDSCAVIIATGVYLNAETVTGELRKKSGPNGFAPATALTVPSSSPKTMASPVTIPAAAAHSFRLLSLRFHSILFIGFSFRMMVSIAAVSGGGWDYLLSPSVGIPEMLHIGVQLTKKIREGRQTPSLPVFCWAMSPAFSGRKPPSAGPGAAPGGDRPPGSGPAAGRRRRG